MTNPTTSGELSSEEFELFWEWLTFVKGWTSSKVAETNKVIRVFDTLDMFESNEDTVAFVKSWDCTHADTIFSYELRVGLRYLSQSQLKKFHRFIVALQAKEKADAEKEKKRQEARERAQKKQRQKAIQYERAVAARQLKQSRSLSLHPSQAEEEAHSKDPVEEKMRIFKEKHGLQAKAGPIARFFTLLRNIKTRSIKALKSPTKIFKKNATVSLIVVQPKEAGGSPESPINHSIEKVDSGDSEEGFTQRLSKANLSIFQEDNCSDEVLSSYRKFNIPSAIDESLISFGSYHNSSAMAYENNSYDMYN